MIRTSYSIETNLPLVNIEDGPVLECHCVDDIECIAELTDGFGVVGGFVLDCLLRALVGDVTGSAEGYEKIDNNK